MSLSEEGHLDSNSESVGAGGSTRAEGARFSAGARGAGSSRASTRAFGMPSQNLSDLEGAVAALEALELIERQVAAARINALAQADRAARREANAHTLSTHAEDSIAYRAARAEIATALHFSEPTIERHLSQAKYLSAQYVATVEALESGSISYRHATIILHAGEIIGEIGIDDADDIAAQRAKYEERVLVHAVGTTPNRLKPIAARIAEEYATRDLDERYETERQFRRVWVSERESGMAELGAYLPAHEAYAIHSRLTQIAKQVESVERREMREREETAETKATPSVSPTPPRRTLRRRDEIRADVLSDFLLNSTGDTATGGPGVGITGIVQVVTHTGQVQEQPPTRAAGGQKLQIPELEGYGPIPVGVARTIAGDTAAWNLITANPATGDVLRVERYRPSEEMRRFLTARDQHCRFPGCRGPAYRGDADHTIDAALGGPTSTSNLGFACRGHHLLKHHSGWKVKQEAYGVYEWTSLTGRIHVDTPVSRVRFPAAPNPGDECQETADRPPKTESQGTAPPETPDRPQPTGAHSLEDPEFPF